MFSTIWFQFVDRFQPSRNSILINQKIECSIYSNIYKSGDKGVKHLRASFNLQTI